MFCKECGKEIQDGSKFCIYCGTNLPEYDRKSPGRSGGVKPPKKALIAIICGAVLVAAAVAAWFFFIRTPVIDLNKYTKIAVYGPDGQGEVQVVFDGDKFYEDHLKKWDEDGRGDAFQVFYRNINWTVSKEEGLKNGDTVELVWDCQDETIEQSFGFKLKHKDLSLVVSGLGDYITSLSQLPKSAFKEMKERAEDQFKYNIVPGFSTSPSIDAREIKDIVSYRDFEYVGKVLAVSKEDGETSVRLIYKLVIEINASKDGKSIHQTVDAIYLGTYEEARSDVAGNFSYYPRPELFPTFRLIGLDYETGACVYWFVLSPEDLVKELQESSEYYYEMDLDTNALPFTAK